MAQFWNLVSYEFRMSIRRRGLWIAYGVVLAFFMLDYFMPSQEAPVDAFGGGSVWQQAGESVYLFNMLMPLIGGILASDRMQRDVHLCVRELQLGAPLSQWAYVLGKYVGVLLSTLLPALLSVLVTSFLAIALRQASPFLAPAVIVAFLAIVVPSFVFVVAFSIACPLILPVRVYQILFTGYWFWGNFLSPEVIPTVSRTLLNASGVYAQQGYFGGLMSLTSIGMRTPVEASLNIAVLALCAVSALMALRRYLAWCETRS